MVVSDAEDELRKRKRLQVKRRNRRLLIEEKDDSIEVLSVKKTIKSKKMLDTLWKLYREPGETVQDVKKRMIDLSENQDKIKSEEITHNEFNRNTFPNVEIKQEPMFDNSEYALEIEEANKTIKTQDGESDSDPENVSYLIKQEYMMNYADSELENDSENEEKTREIAEEVENDESEDEDEEDSDEDEVCEDNHYNIKLENNYDVTDMNGLYDSGCDDTVYWLADHLNVEIIENNNDNIFLPPEDPLGSNLSGENVNWTFERPAEVADNSMLTCSVVESTYNAPKLKQISKNYLVDGKKKKKKKKVEKAVETRTVPKIIIKTDGPVMRIKRESEDDSDKPIICDMYGTRTINYNHPPKVKMPRWQSCSRLSDSDGGSSESEKLKIKKEPKDSDEKPIVKKQQNISPLKMRPENALELRNWFPQQKKNNKKRRNRKKSDSSWCESNVSDYSDIDDFTVTLVKMKKEKRSLTPEIKKERSLTPEIKREKSPTPVYEEERSILESENDTSLLTEENVKNYIWTNNSVAMPMRRTVKKEKKSPPHHEATVDLSIVKKEKTSSDLEDNWKYPSNAKIPRIKNNYNSDSSSSSSSCACSKSSCSCASSSSSSSTSGDEEDEVKVPEFIQEIKKEVLTDDDFVY